MLDLSIPPSRPLVNASMLASDFGCAVEDCRDVLARGADLLHLDVMDGHFVPNLTIGPDMCRSLRKHFPDIFLDVHFMVDRPDLFVEPFAKAGASLISFHYEVSFPCKPAGVDAGALIKKIHSLGVKAGMVVNPGTHAQALEPWLDDLDLVLVMSVVPGKGGQAFIPQTLENVRWLRKRLPARTRLEIDGGISTETVNQAVDAGVDVLVIGSSLFGADDRTDVIQKLHASRG